MAIFAGMFGRWFITKSRTNSDRAIRGPISPWIPDHISPKFIMKPVVVMISTVYRDVLLIKEEKSTNAILFDDCFISQIIIKQFQSSSRIIRII